MLLTCYVQFPSFWKSIQSSAITCHPLTTAIDQTFAILANRCKPQAASMAKLKEMRHMLKQVIFTDICWHQDGKIQHFKETEGYGVEVLRGSRSFVSLIRLTPLIHPFQHAHPSTHVSWPGSLTQS